MMETKADYVFEASWEVCNKVGGIYTVVKSKAGAMMENYKNYFLVGPYIKDKAAKGFSDAEVPKFLKKPFKELEEMGVKCHYGTWQVESEPNTILIEYSNLSPTSNDIKKWLWENYQIDSLRAAWDFTEPMLWGWAVGMMMQKICAGMGKKKVIFHAHEWLSAFSILYLKKNCDKIKTVFTTHATMLGRTIAGNGMDLYEILDSLNPEEKARELHVEEKHTTEKACAHNADVFTTVSEITSMEAEKILDKKADVLLSNGLQVDKFPSIEETSVLHVRNRDEIKEFLSYFFFPYYTFELDHTIVFYIVGRYEFQNKGIDILIEALGKLNTELKNRKSKRTIAMFFWIPMSNQGISKEVAENKKYYVHIKKILDQHNDKIMNKLLHDVVSQKCSVEESLFTSQYAAKLKNDMKNFKRSGNPPLSTHILVNPSKDPIINSLLKTGLDNNPDDNVKVIVYPVYLDGNDGLLDMSYYDALSGGHLGIYPSCYEPWGYTPLESMSMGVTAVTTDLAGFGRFIKPKLLEKNSGIFVQDRYGKTHEESVESLYQILLQYAEYDHAERVQNKINAKQMSTLADWRHFIKNYIQAHNLALNGENEKSNSKKNGNKKKA